MDLSNEQLDEIERLAGLFFAPLNIAIVLQLNADEFLHSWQMKAPPSTPGTGAESSSQKPNYGK